MNNSLLHNIFNRLLSSVGVDERPLICPMISLLNFSLVCQVKTTSVVIIRALKAVDIGVFVVLAIILHFFLAVVS